MTAIGILTYDNAHKTTDYTDNRSTHYLSKGVLVQHHATTHDCSRKQNGNTKPPYWVEGKDMTVCQKSADNKTCSGRMAAHLMPHVYKGTHTLYHQADDQYDFHERWQIKVAEYIYARNIADNIDAIDHISSVLLVHILL